MSGNVVTEKGRLLVLWCPGPASILLIRAAGSCCGVAALPWAGWPMQGKLGITRGALAYKDW